MPASVCIISQPNTLTDADSTTISLSCSSDDKSWFTDDDIDLYLDESLCDKNIIHFPPYVVQMLLFLPDNYEIPIPVLGFTAHTIFCPININDSHWILFIYRKVTKVSYFIDPIFEWRNKLINKETSNKLNGVLNKLFKLNISLIENPHNCFTYQNNSYDCGPFICAYAVLINDGLETFPANFIYKIRNQVIKLKSNKSVKYSRSNSGGGAPETSTTITKVVSQEPNSKQPYKHNLKNEKPCISLLLQYWYKSYTNICVLSNDITYNLISQNNLYVFDNVNLKQFKLVQVVISIIPHNDIWCLLIYSLSLGFCYILDFCNYMLDDRLAGIGENITDYVNRFLLTKKVKFIRNHGLKHSQFVSSDPFYFASIFILQIEKLIFNRNYDRTIVHNSLISLNLSICHELSPSLNSINGKINNKIMNQYFTNLQLPSSMILLDSTMCTAIIDDCTKYLTDFLDFERLYNASTIFAIFRPSKSLDLLIIVDYASDEHYLFNPTTLNNNDNHVKLCKMFVNKINEIKETEGRAPNFGKCPHDIRSSGLFSKLLLCGFIQNFALDRPLINLNLRNIADTIKTLSPIVQESELVLKKTNTKTCEKTQKASLDDRKKKVYYLLEIWKDKDPETLLQSIYENIPKYKRNSSSHNPYLGNKRNKSQPNKLQIRSEFLINMKKTVQIILNEDNINIRPKIQDIIDYFSHSDSKDSDWNPILKFCKKSDSPLILDKFSEEEVLLILKNVDNSAPGQDGIYYTDIMFLDPEGKLLTLLYNKIITSGQIPNCWKSFKTLLIPKPDKSDTYNKVSSWRPIALLSVIYKVFASILARRLTSWTKYNSLLHIGQKGGSEYDGCAEHNSVITAAIEHSKYDTNSPLTIAWLDIKDAFGSVPHEYLWSLLSFIGVDRGFVNMLRLLYTDTQSFYSCGSILTPGIAIKRGVKQGCPISMILFALAIDPVLQAVSSSNILPYAIGTSNLQTLAYADDVALLANNISDLQSIVNTAVQSASLIGFEFRPEKCAFLQMPNMNMTNEILINQIRIKEIRGTEFYQYLGVPVGSNNDQSPYEIIKKVICDTKKLANSDLFGWQKLKAYKTFLHPRLIFPFRTREIKTSALSDPHRNPKCNGNNTTKLRGQLRRILNLSDKAENFYFYNSTDNGGAACTDLLDEYHAQSIVHYFRILTSLCPYTRKINSDSLCFVARTRINKVSPTLIDCFKWINGEPAISNLNSRKTHFQRLRNAINFFKRAHNIVISFEILDQEPALRIMTNIRGTFILKANFRKELATVIHNALFDSYLEKWKASRNSNILISTIQQCPMINKMLYNGKLNEFEWNFIHRARVNNLSILARPFVKQHEDRLCRRCHSTEETMAHILQSCKLNQSLATERHNACLDVIVKYIQSSDVIIEINRVCVFVNESNERVDLRITNDEKKTIYLVDIKCPIDSDTNFQETNARNLSKYENLKNKIQMAKPDYFVELHTCIFGSLGSIPNETNKLLLKLGLNTGKTKKLIKECALINISHSAKIWYFHQNGVLPSHQ